MFAESRRWRNLVVRIAGAFIFIVAVATITSSPAMRSQLFLMSVTILVLPFISYRLGRLSMVGLNCKRSDTAACQAGDSVRITLTLSNEGLLPKSYLYLQDRLPKWVNEAQDSPSCILQLWPNTSQSISYQLIPEMRGVYQIGPLRIQSIDPLGFKTLRGTLPSTSEIIVHPKPIALRMAEGEFWMAQGLPVRDQGASRGIGGDFYGLRDYQCGDELRRVHWPTTARTGKMTVIEQTQGAASELVIALDLNKDVYKDSGTGPESAFEYAVIIAATLYDHYTRQGYAVRLITAPQAGRPVSAQGDRHAAIAQALDFLARADANSPAPFLEILSQYRSLIPQGATLFTITAQPNNGPSMRLPDDFARACREVRFELESASFQAAPAHAPGIQLPENRYSAQPGGTRLIRRGDNLRDAMESVLYAGN